MPDSPPRSPDWRAAAVARSSGEPNSTRHSTSTPAPAASGRRPPRSSGTLPSAPATLTCSTRAPRSGCAASWSASIARPPAAGAYSPGARGATAIGWRSAPAISAGSVAAFERRVRDQPAAVKGGLRRVVGIRCGKRYESQPPRDLAASVPVVWRREHRFDPPAHLAQGLAAQHHLVAVLEERAGRAVGQLDRLLAVPAQLDEAPALFALRSGDRAGREQVTRAQARAVHGQVRDLLRARPVEVTRVGAGDHRAVQLDLERDVICPGLLGEIRQRRRLLPLA